ncbi:hypothetical protein HMPREF9554_01461 [Treponema phagedenis F0421]|nr:hypothetical protein HMPREF9554_01461 [Treponema phagedenis F0421]
MLLLVLSAKIIKKRAILLAIYTFRAKFSLVIEQARAMVLTLFPINGTILQ